jgi:hypothetical protein
MGVWFFGISMGYAVEYWSDGLLEIPNIKQILT